MHLATYHLSPIVTIRPILLKTSSGALRFVCASFSSHYLASGPHIENVSAGLCVEAMAELSWVTPLVHCLSERAPGLTVHVLANAREVEIRAMMHLTRWST